MIKIKFDKYKIDKYIDEKNIVDAYNNRQTKGKELITPLQSIILSLLAILALVVAWYWLHYTKPEYKVNAESLKYTLEAAYNDREFIDDLDRITQFKWDKIYVYPPYTSSDELKKKFKMSDVKFEDSISEDTNQIVFTKNGKVVCYVYGHPDFYNIYIDVGKEKQTLKVIDAKKKPTFLLKQNDDKNYILKFEGYKSDGEIGERGL